MKILVQAVEGNHLHGFKNLFENKKHQWIWWEESHTPAFDVFDEIQPDIFIGYAPLSRAIQKCLSIYTTKTHFMFQNGPYTYTIGSDTLKYPVLVNTDIHKRGRPNPKMVCDIACCETPHPHLLSICHPIGRFNIKVSGTINWMLPQYVGIMTWEELVQLYQSALIVYANTAEEAGRAIACGSICLTSSPRLPELFDENILHVDSSETLALTVENIIRSKDSDDLKKFRDKAEKFLIDNGLTYKHTFEHICELFSKQGIKI